MCPACVSEAGSSGDDYLVRIHATEKSNASFSVNPEGILNAWSNGHRKLMHSDYAAYPGGIKFKTKKKNPDTGEEQEVEVDVDKSNCLAFYKEYEFTRKEWSRINGLKRKRTKNFKHKEGAKKQRKQPLVPRQPANNNNAVQSKQNKDVESNNTSLSEKQCNPTALELDLENLTEEKAAKDPADQDRPNSEFLVPTNVISDVNSQNRESLPEPDHTGTLPAPPLLTREELKFLAQQIREAVKPTEFPPPQKDKRLTQFFERHEKTLREILNKMSQVLSGEQERQHLVKFKRLSKEDIKFYSNKNWGEAKDIGDLLKLLPSAYFEPNENEDFGFFKLACYEGVTNSVTFPSIGLRICSSTQT